MLVQNRVTRSVSPHEPIQFKNSGDGMSVTVPNASIVEHGAPPIPLPFLQLRFVAATWRTTSESAVGYVCVVRLANTHIHARTHIKHKMCTVVLRIQCPVMITHILFMVAMNLKLFVVRRSQ